MRYFLVMWFIWYEIYLLFCCFLFCVREPKFTTRACVGLFF